MDTGAAAGGFGTRGVAGAATGRCGGAVAGTTTTTMTTRAAAGTAAAGTTEPPLRRRCGRASIRRSGSGHIAVRRQRTATRDRRTAWLRWRATLPSSRLLEVPMRTRSILAPTLAGVALVLGLAPAAAAAASERGAVPVASAPSVAAQQGTNDFRRGYRAGYAAGSADARGCSSGSSGGGGDGEYGRGYAAGYREGFRRGRARHC